MRKISACPLCDHEELIYQFTGTDKNSHGPGEFGYSRCGRCGVFFINPQPEERELVSYYRGSDYYSMRGVAVAGPAVRVRRILYRLYFHAERKPWLVQAALLPLKTFSRGSHIRSGARLLDIGCGAGQFPYEMSRFGMRAFGLDPHREPSPDSPAGTEIKSARLEETEYEPESFDVITMNHVLEHVPDPLPTLRAVHRLLKPTGTFIVAVPNARSLAFRFFRRDWYQIDTPRHLFVFSDDILRRLLRRSGFDVVKVRYNSNPRQFTFSLANRLNAPALRRVSVILDLLLMPAVYLINLLKAGDQFEFFCRKAVRDRLN